MRATMDFMLQCRAAVSLCQPIVLHPVATSASYHAPSNTLLSGGITSHVRLMVSSGHYPVCQHAGPMLMDCLGVAPPTHHARQHASVGCTCMLGMELLDVYFSSYVPDVHGARHNIEHRGNAHLSPLHWLYGMSTSAFCVGRCCSTTCAQSMSVK